MYVFAIATSYLLPRSINKYLTNLLSKPYTLAFSNTPGILSPIEIQKSKIMEIETAVIPGGRLGICISCITYSGSLRISGLSDTGVLDQKGL
jgi:hypothetical protein